MGVDRTEVDVDPAFGQARAHRLERPFCALSRRPVEKPRGRRVSTCSCFVRHRPRLRPHLRERRHLRRHEQDVRARVAVFPDAGTLARSCRSTSSSSNPDCQPTRVRPRPAPRGGARHGHRRASAREPRRRASPFQLLPLRADRQRHRRSARAGRRSAGQGALRPAGEPWSRPTAMTAARVRERCGIPGAASAPAFPWPATSPR